MQRFTHRSWRSCGTVSPCHSTEEEAEVQSQTGAPPSSAWPGMGLQLRVQPCVHATHDQCTPRDHKDAEKGRTEAEWGQEDRCCPLCMSLPTDSPTQIRYIQTEPHLSDHARPFLSPHATVPPPLTRHSRHRCCESSETAEHRRVQVVRGSLCHLTRGTPASGSGVPGGDSLWALQVNLGPKCHSDCTRVLGRVPSVSWFP